MYIFKNNCICPPNCDNLYMNSYSDYSIMFFMYDPNKIDCENLLFSIGIVLREHYKFHWEVNSITWVEIH